MKKQSRHPASPLEISKAPSSLLREGDLLAHKSRAYGKYLIGLIAILVFLLLFLFRFSLGEGKYAEADYFKAANAFHTFENLSSDATLKEHLEALKTLETLLTKRPELHAAYDGLIAQTLMNRKLVQEAQPFAEAALSQIKKADLPLYAHFAKTTLNICGKKYAQALQEAQLLSKQMEEQAGQLTFGQTLTAFNLLRLAILSHHQGNLQEEQKVWEAWKVFSKQSPLAYEKLAQAFETEKILLASYIEAREKILKNNSP